MHRKRNFKIIFKTCLDITMSRKCFYNVLENVHRKQAHDKN